MMADLTKPWKWPSASSQQLNSSIIVKHLYAYYHLTIVEESAESEPAWNAAGKKPGLQIWRIVVNVLHNFYIIYAFCRKYENHYHLNIYDFS